MRFEKQVIIWYDDHVVDSHTLDLLNLEHHLFEDLLAEVAPLLVILSLCSFRFLVPTDPVSECVCIFQELRQQEIEDLDAFADEADVHWLGAVEEGCQLIVVLHRLPSYVVHGVIHLDVEECGVFVSFHVENVVAALIVLSIHGGNCVTGLTGDVSVVLCHSTRRGGADDLGHSVQTVDGVLTRDF